MNTEPSAPWFSNESKVGLGLAGAAAVTLGLFALAVKIAPSKNGSGNAQARVVPQSEVPRVGRNEVVPMKTLQVTLSMEVPRDFEQEEIDVLLARLRVVADPSCKYLGVDAVGVPWGAPARGR